MGTTDIEKSISNSEGAEKVDLLLEASSLQSYNQADSLEFALKGIRYAKELGYEKGMAYGLQRAGSISMSLGDTDSAIKNLLSSLEHYDKANDKYGMGESLLLLGKCYLQTEDLPRSAEYFVWSVSEFKKAGDLRGEATASNNSGFVYKLSGDYDRALENYDNALSIYRRLNDKKDEAVLLSNIAKLYFDKKDYLEAIEFYEEALSVLPEEDQLYKSELLYGLAMAFSKGNDHKRAESALEESRDIKTGIDDKNGLGKVEAALDVQKAVIKGTHDSPIRKDSGTDETRDNKNMTSELRLSSDIKTYLTAIIGNAQHLKENHSEMADEEIQDVITDIETGAFNINSIINDYTGHDFVDFEQEEADLEDVNLNEVIDEVVGSLRDKLEAKGVKHIGHSTSNAITASSDREAVKNILNSVVSNAVEVTPAGKNIYSYLTVKNGKIRCEIIDEGSNSSEFHSSLSDLAKNMGGTLTYESMIGGGGTFVLIFNEAKK